MPRARETGGTSSGHFASGMHQPAIPHGSEHRRKREIVPQYASFEIAIGNGDRPARTEGYVAKGATIFVEREFRFGAAIEVVEDCFRQTALGKAAQIFDIDDL